MRAAALSLSFRPCRETLGADMFDGARNLAKRTAFRPDTALVFVPSSQSWHGFLPRPIAGVRKSVIVNYVTGDWRAKAELSFPDAPVPTAAP
jgi:hypothetical protein